MRAFVIVHKVMGIEEMSEGVEHRRGAFFGIAAAALFGCSAPVAKLLLPQVGLLPLSAFCTWAQRLGSPYSGSLAKVLAGDRARRPYAARIGGCCWVWWYSEESWDRS